MLMLQRSCSWEEAVVAYYACVGNMHYAGEPIISEEAELCLKPVVTNK